MRIGGTERPMVFRREEHEDELYLEIREIAAKSLNPLIAHTAASGSAYVYVGEFKIRFADHENTAERRSSPVFNCVKRDLHDWELQAISEDLTYPTHVKKTALALHVGLSVPKLKKILLPEHYVNILIDPMYPNTFYEYVLVRPALEFLNSQGYTQRIPVSQETWTEEIFD